MQTTSYQGRNRPIRRHPILSVALSAACLGIVPGCSADGDGGNAPAELVVSVSDSSGVEIVSNDGWGWGPDAAWRLEPDLQVGELDGPLAFGRISWVSPGPANGLLVLDGQAHLIHAFDSVGVPIGRFGGEGEGPGEFRRPAAVTPTGDGRLAVSQGFPPVLHWLTPEGEYLSSTRLPGARDEAGTRTAGAFGVWQVTSSGRAFVQVQVFDPGASEGEMPVVLLEADPAGEAPPDTIATWKSNAVTADLTIRLFEPNPTWMPRSDGVVVLSKGSPYRIEWHDPSSGLVRVVRREVEAEPVTAEHRDRAIADMREAMSSGGAPDSRVEEILGNVEFESRLPEVLRVWVSEPDGRLWIGVHDPELPEPESAASFIGLLNAWDVFEREGRYLGRIPVPNGFTLRVVTEKALYGFWQDELEVPFARRYRVIRPAGD